MPGHERRHGHRFIMRVPLRFRATKEVPLKEESVFVDEYLRARRLFRHGPESARGPHGPITFEMPKEIVGDEVEERSFTGRVAHLEPLSRQNGKSGVGVQFLFYEVPRPVMK